MYVDTRKFRDRKEAGQRLAGMLGRYRDEKPLVLALPRGGVPVGYEIARALGAPLDVTVARKLGTPGQPELAMGAVAPGGGVVLNERVIRQAGVTREQIEEEMAEEIEEAGRRLRRFRDDRPDPVIEGRTVILVDDGIATGMTVRAAIRALRKQRPARIVLAVPVCAAETAKALRPEVDDLVCAETPEDLWAIGLWYHDFEQVSDREVIEILERARSDGGGTGDA